MTGFRFPVVLVAVAAIAVGVSACAGAAVPVPTPRVATSSVVTVQLDSATSIMATQGFELTEGYRNGALNDGEEEVLSLDLAGERTYMIAAVCDQDCSDLDLELADASGETIDSDFELDDVPMVMTQGARAGRHSLTVSMASCEVEPCAYGVAIYRQR